MIHAHHNGFKITDCFGGKVQVETFTGNEWRFIFNESTLDAAKNRINLMGVICKSSVSKDNTEIYKGFNLVSWEGGLKVESLKNDKWVFLFNSPSIESAKNAIDIMFPKSITYKYDNYHISKYGYNSCVSVEFKNGELMFNSNSISIAKHAIDIINKNESESMSLDFNIKMPKKIKNEQ